MGKDEFNSLAVRIKSETYVGTEELQKCNFEQAIEHFDSAYQAAIKIEDDQVKRACAFNLGAAHIANHNPVKGITCLKRAITSNSTDTSHTNGDLYYNFGLAYELLGGKSEATKYFELALEEYQRYNDLRMAAEVAGRIGVLYLSQKEMLQAARVYSIAAISFGGLSDIVNQAMSLSQQAGSLLKAGKITDTLRLADDCMLVCQKSDQSEALGKIYNELGLIYTQCTDYNQAQKCFELALPLSRGPEDNKRQQAVILQNLGATYNFLGDYQRALGFHESAIAMHANLNNRNAQGQCFLNLAYAYSRLGDTESAGECYLHALQAAKDTDDTHSQWQALEGLGAVYYHSGNYHRAIKYYQQAISALTKSGESNPIAQERLMAKLNDALECNLPSNSPQQNVGSSPAISPMQEKPTRQRVKQLTQIRANPLIAKKVPYEFERIAMGLGEYDIDSDYAIPDNRRHQKLNPDEVDQVLRRSNRSKKRHHHQNEHNRSASLSSGQDYQSSGERRQAAQKRLPHRQSTRRKFEEHGHRSAFSDSLLKPEGCSTEEENRKNGDITEPNKQQQQELINKEKSSKLLAAMPLQPRRRESDLDSIDTEANSLHKEGNPSENDSDVSDRASQTGEETDPEKQYEEDDMLSLSSTNNNSEAELKRYHNELEKIVKRESDAQSERDTSDSRSESGEESNPEVTFTGTLGYSEPVTDINECQREDKHCSDQENIEDNRIKVSLPDEEDPTYQRISSLIPDVKPPELSVNPRDHQPTLPKPPLSQLSTGEQEAFLNQYRQHHLEHTRDQVGRPEDDDLLLPQRKRNKQTSKACVLM